MTFNLDICKFEGQSHRMKNVPFRLRIALYLLLRPRSIVMSASVCLFVCLSVCLSVCPTGYLWNHTRDLYQIFVRVAYVRGSVLLQHVYDRLHRLSPGGIFFPIANAL